jgi:hypothetical protein
MSWVDRAGLRRAADHRVPISCLTSYWGERMKGQKGSRSELVAIPSRVGAGHLGVGKTMHRFRLAILLACLCTSAGAETEPTFATFCCSIHDGFLPRDVTQYSPAPTMLGDVTDVTARLLPPTLQTARFSHPH